jgi:hypothetical protein
VESVPNRTLSGIKERDDLGIERCIAIGDVSVEFHTRLRAIFGVVVSAGFTMSAGAKELAVRRRCVTVAPYRRAGLSVNGIDQTGERGPIGFVAHMPFGDP